jgi:hypothetical protein
VENSRQAFLRFGLSGVVSQSWGRGAVPQLARLTTLALTGTFEVVWLFWTAPIVNL